MSGCVYPMTESVLMQTVLAYRMLSERKSKIDDLYTQYNMHEANMKRQLETRHFSQKEIDKLLDDRPEKLAIMDVLEDIANDLHIVLRKIRLIAYDISDEDPLFRGNHRDVSFRGFTGIPCPVCHNMRSFRNGSCMIDGSSQYIDAYEECQVKGAVTREKQHRCTIM
jgi:hypothetical protein